MNRNKFKDTSTHKNTETLSKAPLNASGSVLVIGSSIPITQLLKLNKDLDKFKGNKKQFINIGGKLVLTNKLREVDDWDWD